MRRCRRAPIFLTVVAAMLLSVAQVEYDIAVVDIVWRTSVLSWDSPSTQVFDEVASQPISPGDSATSVESRPVHASQPLRLTAQERPSWPGLPGPVTRAPPSA